MIKFKHISRLRDISLILFKYGFVEIVESTPLSSLIPAKNKIPVFRTEQGNLSELNRWERIKMVVEELGPTFIKFAQVLSNRPDVLPIQLIKEFEKLQDQVNPIPFSEILELIEQETGLKKVQLFDWLEEEPVGSASIGQVHKAKLRTGELVAVKVQKPGIKKIINTDLDILREFIKSTEGYFVKNGVVNPLEVLDTFRKTIQKELNYRIEAKNIIDFTKIAAKLKNIEIPKVLQEYSTEQLLITTFLEGCKIIDVDQLDEWGVNKKEIIENGFSAYVKQIFSFGIFHADPHPGNILVTKEGQINLVDFGMMGRMSNSMRTDFSGIFIGIANQDPRTVAINLYQLAIDSRIDDFKELEFDISLMLEEIGSLDNESMELSRISDQLQQLIYKHRVRLPGSIFMVLRALIILEGIKKQLHPELDIFKIIKPYSGRLLREYLTPKNLIPNLISSSREISGLFKNLPYELQHLLTNLRRGKTTIRLDQPELGELNKQLRHSTFRLSMALVLSSLIIALAFNSSALESSGIKSSTVLTLLFILFLVSAIVFIISLLRK